MSIIDDLKQNEKPFGLMSEEMREAMTTIGKKELQVWCAGGWALVDTSLLRFNTQITYRLSPDYQEQGGVVKCEVRTTIEHRLQYNDTFYPKSDNEWTDIVHALGSDLFIGYLYENGVVSSLPRMYRILGLGSRNFFCNIEHLGTGGAEVLTPTHVLFKDD